MGQQKVRFAVLGFGLHATRRLMPAFVASEHAELVGLWRRDQAAAAQNCAEFKVPHCFATREELCTSPDVDVVFITSPDAMHRDDALLAFQHGKAVLCEKPLAMNATEAEEMAAAAKAAGKLFGVAQNFRYNRSLEWMREQVLAGRIGEPQLASAMYSYPAKLAPRKWIMDHTLACGGPIADVGVHCIDALRFVLNQNVTSIATIARKDGFSDQVEAVASLQMEMTGGIYATVTASARGLYRTQIEVTGSEGVLIAENGLTVDRPVELVVRSAGELVESSKVENGDGYLRMLDAFAEAWRGGQSFAATGEDGVLNMKALDAAFRSWREGVRLPV